MLKLKKYEQAEINFLKSVEQNNEKISGYIGLADCCRLQNKFEEAIDYYSIAIEKDPNLFSVIGLKRAICYIEIQEIEKAEEDIDKVKFSFFLI